MAFLQPLFSISTIASGTSFSIEESTYVCPTRLSDTSTSRRKFCTSLAFLIPVNFSSTRDSIFGWFASPVLTGVRVLFYRLPVAMRDNVPKEVLS